MIYNIIRLHSEIVKEEFILKKLTDGNIYKTFILFAIPLVLAGILSQGYNMIDTVIAGKVLGSDGLAATGASAAFLTFLTSVFWGYCNGFSIYVARLYGANEYKELKSAIVNNVVMVFIVGILIAVLVFIFRESIMDFLKVAADIRHQAMIYMLVYTAGLCFIASSANFVYIMNALGSAGYPFAVSVVSAFINVGGNIFTLVVLGWGVSGVAVSTVLSAVVANIMYIVRIRKCFRELGVDKHRVKFSKQTFKRSFVYSGNTMIQQMVMYLSTVMISPLVNGIGSSATAAYNVVTKIYDINAGIFQNSSKTLSNYIAQCIGAGRLNTIKKGLRVGLLQGTVLLLPVLLLCICFSDEVCRMFFPVGFNGEALDLSIIFVKLYLPFILLCMINNLFHSFFRGTASMSLLVIATTIGAGSRLLLSFILAPKMGMNGIYLAWVLSWAIELVYALTVYFMGLWKKTINTDPMG